MTRSKLSVGQQRRLLILASSALIAALAWGVVLPAWHDLTGLKAELADLEAHLPPALPGPVPIAAMIQRMRLVARLLAADGQRFPVSENVATLLVELQGVKSTGTDITRFYPTELLPVTLPQVATKDLAVSQQRVLIDARGDFFALRAFLARLEHFPDPLQIRSIALNVTDPVANPEASRSADPRLALEVDLSAFLIDRPLGDPQASERALERLVNRLQVQVLDARPRAVSGVPPPPRPLLGPPQVPQPPLGRRVLKDSLGSWKTLGILATQQTGPVAILSIDGIQTAVAKGDVLAGGWMVDHIEQDAVVVRRGLVVRRLPLIARPQQVCCTGPGSPPGAL